MAANGYPGTPEKGGAIAGLDRPTARAQGLPRRHRAATSGRLVADGGRVLSVTARGRDGRRGAATRAYRAVDAIDFPTGFCRRDIGWREIERRAAQMRPRPSL